MSLDFVPQIFYDLISRVIPGSLTLLAWYVTIRGPRQAAREIGATLSNEKLSEMWLIALLILLAYILGFILRELWSLTFGKWTQKRTDQRNKRYRQSALTEHTRARSCRGAPDLKLTYEALPATHKMMDDVRRRSPPEGYRLLKLRAEAHLCEGLFAGLVLLPLLNAALWFIDPTTSLLGRVFLELAILIALVTTWRADRRLRAHHVSGVCGAWLAFSFALEPTKPEDR